MVEKNKEQEMEQIFNELTEENKSKGVIKMFEVTYIQDGVQKQITINANDSMQAMNVFTNMYGIGSIQVINIRRI